MWLLLRALADPTIKTWTVTEVFTLEKVQAKSLLYTWVKSLSVHEDCHRAWNVVLHSFNFRWSCSEQQHNGIREQPSNSSLTLTVIFSYAGRHSSFFPTLDLLALDMKKSPAWNNHFRIRFLSGTRRKFHMHCLLCWIMGNLFSKFIKETSILRWLTMKHYSAFEKKIFFLTQVFIPKLSHPVASLMLVWEKKLKRCEFS